MSRSNPGRGGLDPAEVDVSTRVENHQILVELDGPLQVVATVRPDRAYGVVDSTVETLRQELYHALGTGPDLVDEEADEELATDGGQELPPGYESPKVLPTAELRDGETTDERSHAARNAETLRRAAADVDDEEHAERLRERADELEEGSA